MSDTHAPAETADDPMTEPDPLDFGEQELTGFQMGEDYLRRSIAVREAKVILTGTSKLFAQERALDVGSLIVLADWLLGVEDDPETVEFTNMAGEVVARVET